MTDTRQQNRNAMPVIAAFVDSLRTAMKKHGNADFKVTYAEENGVVLGRSMNRENHHD